MRTISSPAHDAARLKEVLAAFGRRRSLRDPMAAACAELDLTPTQIHALLWLRRDGALAMGEISRRLGITEKTMTGIADRLVRRGLVRRLRDERDRRLVLGRLTRAGQRHADKLDEQMTQAMELLMSMLSATDRAHLIRILEGLQLQLERAAA
jgi:DNA-binding MarR family transcriptional regulator